MKFYARVQSTNANSLVNQVAGSHGPHVAVRGMECLIKLGFRQVGFGKSGYWPRSFEKCLLGLGHYYLFVKETRHLTPIFQELKRACRSSKPTLLGRSLNAVLTSKK
jgi:hypothetical protein